MTLEIETSAEREWVAFMTTGLISADQIPNCQDSLSTLSDRASLTRKRE
jgi:hypothetical protein